MGIKNLLCFLKPFIKPIHIGKYSGKRVGIDAYSWLHKGAYSCSMDLCLNLKTEKSKRYLKYFMHRINLLKHYKITPVVVFDGGSIPCKSATQNDRHRRREANLEIAKRKHKEGNETASIEFFQKAVSITPTMAHELIQILRLEKVEFIVAPYEADAQLAYLSNLHPDQGGIEAVITEDSDLIAYGCQAVIFKMDQSGNGEEFLMDRLFTTVSDGLSFMHFDKELFTGMCVLAGCDFLPSVPGIGTKRAHSLVSKYRNLDRVISVLKLDKKYQMPEDYPESFGKANAVFHHARVYDAETKSLKLLKPFKHKHLQSLNGDLDILGPDLPSSIAAAIADGHLDPTTMEAFDHFPKAETCSNTVSIALQHLRTSESQTTFTQESCITIFSADESISNKVSEVINLDQETYKKDALALGKLVAATECHRIIKHDVEKREVPNNNPFKRRKVVGECSELRESCIELASVLINVEETGDVLCSSSPESQESVKSRSPRKLSASKDKIHKTNKTKNDHNGMKSGPSGILKFFQRL